MGFLRKAAFVATGGMSGLVFKANSKKERIANATEAQLRLLQRLSTEEDTYSDLMEIEEEVGVFHLSLTTELANLADLRDSGIITADEFDQIQRQAGGRED